MYQYNDIIPNDFAEIFEQALDEEGRFSYSTYYRLRDDFWQITRSTFQNGEQTSEEIFQRFDRKPNIENELLLAFAAGTACYYLHLLDISEPSWCSVIEPVDINGFPFFGSNRLTNLQEMIDRTPPEMQKYGFIYDEHNFDIL